MAKRYVSEKDNRVYEKFIDEATVNLSQNDYDQFIEDNCEHFRKAGISSVIIRRQLANCCEFCAALAGVYDYSPGGYPSEIFVRHENCRCLVTVKQEKGGYQDVWSKVEYKTQREARKTRQEELARRDDAIGLYFKEKNIAENNGELFANVTGYWNIKPKEKEQKIIEIQGQFEIHGHNIDPKKPDVEILIGHTDKEEQVVQWWAEKYGGRILWIPRVRKPQYIKTPDICVDGIYYDIKHPTGGGKWVIDHQVYEATGQADNVIIDLTYSPLKEKPEEILRQIKGVYKSSDYTWLKQLIVIADNKIMFATERI